MLEAYSSNFANVKKNLLKVQHIHMINKVSVAPIPANPAKAMSVFLNVYSGSATRKNSTKPSWKELKINIRLNSETDKGSIAQPLVN